VSAVTVRPARRRGALATAARISCLTCALLFASLLAGCASSDGAATSASATLSAGDAEALAFIDECEACMDASAPVADRVLAMFEDGSWTETTQDEGAALQIEAMQALFAVGDLYASRDGEVPLATSSDIRALEEGPLDSAVSALWTYLGRADEAALVMTGAQGPTAADREAAPRHERQLRKWHDRYLAARETFDRDLAALRSVYGQGE